jgi:hypothetical protein
MLNRLGINRKAIKTRRIATKGRNRRRQGYGGPGGSQKKDKIYPLVYTFSALQSLRITPSPKDLAGE